MLVPGEVLAGMDYLLIVLLKAPKNVLPPIASVPAFFASARTMTDCFRRLPCRDWGGGLPMHILRQGDSVEVPGAINVCRCVVMVDQVMNGRGHGATAYVNFSFLFASDLFSLHAGVDFRLFFQPGSSGYCDTLCKDCLGGIHLKGYPLGEVGQPKTTERGAERKKEKRKERKEKKRKQKLRLQKHRRCKHRDTPCAPQMMAPFTPPSGLAQVFGRDRSPSVSVALQTVGRAGRHWIGSKQETDVSEPHLWLCLFGPAFRLGLDMHVVVWLHYYYDDQMSRKKRGHSAKDSRAPRPAHAVLATAYSSRQLMAGGREKKKK